MRLFALLLLAFGVTFASIQAPVLLEEQVAGPVVKQFLGKSWTQIYSCNGNGANVLSAAEIKALAATATQVLITNSKAGAYGADVISYVYSKPETYPIRQLRKGQTLSFQISPPATTILASQAVIAATWVGPAELTAKLWNSCGQPGALGAAGAVFYWACNNGRGLHLGADKGVCMWDWTLKYERPIEIYIDAGSRPNSGPFVPPARPGGCDTCRNYNGKPWTRIYSCTSNSVALWGADIKDIPALAKQASQVLINNVNGYYVTSNPGTYPIQQLRLGQTISYRLPPDNWAEPEDVVESWTGPSFLIDRLWSACAQAGPIVDRLFHACNNQEGLHIAPSSKRCEWDWLEPDGPIEVFVDAPCTCPNDYNSYENAYVSGETNLPPPPPPEGNPPPPPSGGGYAPAPNYY